MKIMSYIQKTIYALFLLALFSGCTDEVLDGGGNGSTPIEEGKLVNVKFVLDQAGAKTVETKNFYEDPATPVINDLLFLQYKDEGDGYQLVHTWYTNSAVSHFGNSKTIEVQLLSGSGYIVYVLSNIKKYNGVYEEEIVERYILNNIGESGILPLDSKVYTSFGTPNDVKTTKFEPPLSWGPFGEEVMMAVATNIDKANGDVTFTHMPTYLSRPSDQFVNSATEALETVDITENNKLYATFYVPYAKVSFKIKTNLNSDIKIELTSVCIVNSVKGYSLANGFSLNEFKGGIGWYDQKYPTVIYGESENYGHVGGDPITLNGTNEHTFADSYWIYENMAGILNPINTDERNKVPANDNVDSYTYFEVKGKYCTKESSTDITYRFILGKDSYANCNVERNVHYKVTMTLKGNGGIDEQSWRVEYKKPDEPIIEGVEVLQALDAHESKNTVTFKNMPRGTYYIVATGKKNGNEFVDPATEVDLKSLKLEKVEKNEHTNYYAWDLLNNTQSTIREAQMGSYKPNDCYYDIARFSVAGDGDMTLHYLQEGWFDYSAWDRLLYDRSHQKGYPLDVAKSLPTSYCLFIYDDKYNNVGKIEVTQYPPIVVMRDGTNIESLDKNKIENGNSVLFMERIENDDKADSRTHSWTWNVDPKDFNYVFGEGAESNYWLNPRGPLVENKDSYSPLNLGWSVPTNKQNRFVVYKQS